MRHAYTVAGMHCRSCVAKVTRALQEVPGVAAADVSLQPPRADVEMATHVPTDQLDRAAQAAGNYRIRELQLAAAPPAELHEISPSPPSTAATRQESLYPLLLIVGYLVGVIALIALATDERSPHVLMRYFMGGFFLVFSFFKLLDLRGFAAAYRSYDLLAGVVPAWGFAYPLVELSLGAAYLLDVAPMAVNLTTLVVMLIGAAGVLKALLARRSIRCACLGTALNLPMTKVTLIEDLAMAIMAAIALVPAG